MSDTQAPDGVQEIRKIYLKDVSFESPTSPAVFTQGELTPDVDINMRIRQSNLDETNGFYEVVLLITITARSGEHTLFLCEVQQAGIFEIRGLDADALARALEVDCPGALLPFAREAICELVGKGGFPQLLLSPVDFSALHAKKLEGATEVMLGSEPQGTGTPH